MPIHKLEGPLPDGHPLKGVSIVFGRKPSESSPKESPGLQPPVRESYQTQEDWEEAVGFWNSRFGRIKAMAESQSRRKAASQTEASKTSPETSADSSPAAGNQPSK
jgi:hypothetical protein